VLAHANGVLSGGDSAETMKAQVIQSILSAGKDVEAFIIQHGLDNDEHAFQTESALYGLLALLDGGLDNGRFSLTNIVSPPGFEEFGLRSVDDVLAQYGAPADGSLIPHNSLFIKPTETWRKGMSRDELWRYTRGWWPLNIQRMRSIRYVISVPNFVVRGVWEVSAEDWRHQGPGDNGWDSILEKRAAGRENSPRWGFGSFNDVTESKFGELLNKSVEHFYKAGQGKRPSVIYLDDSKLKHLLKTSGSEAIFWNRNLR